MAGMEEWALEVVGTIIAGVAVGIILYLVFKKRTEKQQVKRQNAKVKRGEVVQAQESSKIVIDKSHGKRVFHGVGRSPSASKAPQSKSKKGRRKPESKRKTITRKITVIGGDMRKIDEYISEGSRVEGLAEEPYSDFFHFYIVDDKNYEQLRNEGVVDEALFTGFDLAAYHFDVVIPHSGYWHFVFSTYAMKNDREIDFRCTILRKEVLDTPS